MELGIIGLARSGKTSLFNAVTRGSAQVGEYSSGREPNVGVVHVPDERVDAMAAIFQPKRTIYAEIRWVDFPVAGFGVEGPGSIVRRGSSLKSWKTTPMRRRNDGIAESPSRAMLRPSTTICPSLGCAAAKSSRSRVVLPAPLGPVRNTNSPLRNSRLTSRRAKLPAE